MCTKHNDLTTEPYKVNDMLASVGEANMTAIKL